MAVQVGTPRRDGRSRRILRETGQLTIFAGRAIRGVPGSLPYFSEALRHCAAMVTGSIVLLFFMSMFQGAAIGNFVYFFLRTIGASDFFGVTTGYLIPRQTGTLMFGYVFAAKIGCGMTAELGTMKIQQEVDAFDSSGVDPVRYLVVTRLLAVVLFVPLATAVALLGNVLGSFVIVGPVAGGLSATQLFSLHWGVQSLVELIFPLMTIAVIALICATIACFYGLRTRGGPADVGTSVARSLAVNLVVLHVIASVAAVIVYGGSLGLPIAP